MPKLAISMSVRQILKAKEILAVVPDTRKAKAVTICFEGEISPRGRPQFCARIPCHRVFG